jgi:hypothetical protein
MARLGPQHNQGMSLSGLGQANRTCAPLTDLGISICVLGSTSGADGTEARAGVQA